MSSIAVFYYGSSTFKEALADDKLKETKKLNKRFCEAFLPNPSSSVSSEEDLRTGCCWFKAAARPIISPRIDDGHCVRNRPSLTAVHCFDDGYVVKQPVAWEVRCTDYWLKELQESMDRCIWDVTKITLKAFSDVE